MSTERLRSNGCKEAWRRKFSHCDEVQESLEEVKAHEEKDPRLFRLYDFDGKASSIFEDLASDFPEDFTGHLWSKRVRS